MAVVWGLPIQGAPIKNNPLEKMLYFKTVVLELNFHTLYVSIHATCPANFIAINDTFRQREQFKL